MFMRREDDSETATSTLQGSQIRIWKGNCERVAKIKGVGGGDFLKEKLNYDLDSRYKYRNGVQARLRAVTSPMSKSALGKESARAVLTRLTSPAGQRATRSALVEYFGVAYNVAYGGESRARSRRGGGGGSGGSGTDSIGKKRVRVRHSLTDEGGHARQRLRALLARVAPFMASTKFTRAWAAAPNDDEAPVRARPARRRTPANMRRRLRQARIALGKIDAERKAAKHKNHQRASIDAATSSSDD